MSNEENSNQAIDSKKNAAANLMSSMVRLKEQNPKVFFGVIGVLVIAVLVMIMSGGDSTTSASKSAIKNLALGQRYVLKSANAYDPAATVRLVSTPGAIAAYDDTEEADRSGACQHMPQGTQVTAVDFADAYGKKNAYVKVKIEDGECKGNEAWALAIDVQ